MAKSNFEIAFQLGAKMDPSVKKAFGNTQKQLGNMRSNITKTLKSGAKLAAGFAATGAAVGGAAIAMANKFASSADVIDKNSMKVGISAEAYQEYQHAMSQVGVSQDNFDKAMGRLNQRLANTGANDKYRKSIQALGVATEDANDKTRNADDVFMDTVQKLHEMEDSTRQAALAQEIFGTKTARELMPAITAGGDAISDLRGEAHDLNAVISDDGVKAGVLWADTMDKAKTALGGMFNSVAGSALPILQKFLDYGISKMPVLKDAISNAVSKAGDVLSWIGQTGKDVFQNIKNAIADNQPTIDRLKDAFSSAGDTLQTAFDSAKPYINWLKDEGIPLAVDAIAGIIDTAMDFYQKIKDNWSTIGPIVTGIAIALGSLKLAFMVMGVVQTVTTFITAFKTATAAAKLSMLGLNGAMLANPIVWIIALIVGLIAIGVLLYKNWDTVKEKAQGLWGSIKEVFGSIGDFISGVWDGVKESTKAAINAIISGVNAMIRGVNNFQIKVPAWIRKLPLVPDDMTSVGFNIPTIPMLADGGITTGATLAMIGEGAEQEAVLPLSKLQALMDTPAETNQSASINYQPTVIINGNADRKDIDNALSKDRREFEKSIEAYLHKRRRLSY